ncbi:cobalt transporter CbiM [Desulfatitalea alkaliphila]|uniref:Cobalt transporter CbiM n=1 Tax=Desulfatitalea alkaliphila TaxID=2929485 RepID=A0AA41QZQ0_9BACT|nr:cobalt transporter CbiM [Desulfatitalea alkaliphila]MCJ8499357.1 cobalt transporter CbiM [Desulfatitalea alkaliphila]
MHISEGYLSAAVLISGGGLAAAGTAIGLKRLDYDQIAQAGILASAFFVASLVHVPIGPANIHLILNGLLGLLLGWAAFPVILAALLLQAVFFQYGGITTLGVNTVIMAAPAVAVHYLCGPWIGRNGWRCMASAFAGGAGAIVLAAVVMAAALYFTDKQFFTVAATAVAIHVPIMVIEGVITLFCVGFLKKVKPELLPHNVVQPPQSREVV